MYKSSFQGSRLVERRYQRLLEDEQRSLARNKKLLEDIDRLEEQMEYFSREFKQNEEKLDHAKDKFMQYVKSVYPKWSADLKKWQEAKNESLDPIAQSDQKRTFVNPGSALHSTPRTGQLGFEGSPSPHIREDPGTKYGGSLGHPRDKHGSYMDKTVYNKDEIGYPKERASLIKGSLRDRTDLSWDEMGFHGGYLGNDMRYPQGGTMVYPQHSPHGMYPHPAHPYVLPMPAYGMPRWTVPGYQDPWSMSYAHCTSYENYGKADQQNTSFETRHSYKGHERPQRHETLLQRDASPNSENREFSGRFHAENLPGSERYPAEQYSDKKQDLFGSLMQEAETQQLKRREEEYKGSIDAGTLQDHGEGGKNYDPKNMGRQEPRKETRDGLSPHSDVCNGKFLQQRNSPDQGGHFNEKLTDHTTFSSVQFGEQQLASERERFVEPVGDARLIQLRSKGNQFGSGEVINTDSISLPTIHQYEGDPGEIFSDISSSEPLNQDDSLQVKSKHSKSGNLSNQPPSGRDEWKQPMKKNSGRDNSDGKELKQDAAGLGSTFAGFVGDGKAEEKNEKINSNVLQKNKLGRGDNNKGLVTPEMSKVRPVWWKI